MPLIAKHEPDERRSKVDQMTGETRSKQPTWTQLQEHELGTIGDLFMQHGHYERFAQHWRNHRYSDPVDTINLARELLTELGITAPPGASEE
jgi:hypothetical protein